MTKAIIIYTDEFKRVITMSDYKKEYSEKISGKEFSLTLNLVQEENKIFIKNESENIQIPEGKLIKFKNIKILQISGKFLKNILRINKIKI